MACGLEPRLDRRFALEEGRDGLWRATGPGGEQLVLRRWSVATETSFTTWEQARARAEAWRNVAHPVFPAILEVVEAGAGASRGLWGVEPGVRTRPLPGGGVLSEGVLFALLVDVLDGLCAVQAAEAGPHGGIRADAFVLTEDGRVLLTAPAPEAGEADDLRDLGEALRALAGPGGAGEKLAPWVARLTDASVRPASAWSVLRELGKVSEIAAMRAAERGEPVARDTGGAGGEAPADASDEGWVPPWARGGEGAAPGPSALPFALLVGLSVLLVPLLATAGGAQPAVLAESDRADNAPAAFARSLVEAPRMARCLEWWEDQGSSGEPYLELRFLATGAVVVVGGADPENLAVAFPGCVQTALAGRRVLDTALVYNERRVRGIRFRVAPFDPDDVEIVLAGGDLF